jgi:hypothetical protein
MDGGATQQFGDKEATKLINAGWRQGSVFRPPAPYPVPIDFDAAHEWMVVCSQSCTVVSPRLDNDPTIEIIVAKQVEKFAPQSPEARGKNVRRFHLPILGTEGFQALDCNINRRLLMPRREFLHFAPHETIKASVADVRNLAGWIARYYTRIALPNELVRRATQKHGLFEIIKSALEWKTPNDTPLSELIDGVYIQWEPDEEMVSSEPYLIDLLFLCSDNNADSSLAGLLLEPLKRFTGDDGIALRWDSKVALSTFISDLDGYTRLSEWDYLSSLRDVAQDRENLSLRGPSGVR